MKTQRILMVVISVVLALAACVAPVAAPTPTPSPVPPPTPTPLPEPTSLPLAPAEVVTRAAAAFSAGDLEGGMAYWADDAIWYIFGLPPNGSEIIRGKEAIRAELENEIAAHLTWEIDPQSVVGNVVTSHDTTWLDFTRQIGVAPVQATGQYLVEDGKIATYAWTIDPESLVKLKAALAELPAEPAAEPATEPAAEPEAEPAAEPAAEPEATAPAPAPVSELTVTIADGACSIEQPVALKAGGVQLTVDVQDENRDGYAVVFLTLNEGKDFTDLMAASTGSPPSWAFVQHYEEVDPASAKTYTIRASAGRPLYGICFSRPPDQPIGNLGPIAVSE